MSQDSLKPGKVSPPKIDPEVRLRTTRRRFTTEDKLRILAEADACTEIGQIGALLRREGLYSSTLSQWRQQRLKGTLNALAPKKRGPRPDPLASENASLRHRNEFLEAELKRANTIIDFQKKIYEILGLTDPQKNGAMQ